MRFLRPLAAVLLSLAALLPAASPATAADAPTYELAYKFRAGEAVRWEVIHRATIKTTIKDSTQTAQTRSDSVKRWRIDNVTPGGAAQITHSVESVKMTNQLPGRAEQIYDSQEHAVPPAGFEQAAASVGVPLTLFRIDRQGKVLRREQKHPHGNGGDSPIALPLPTGRVPVGHVWTEPMEVTVSLPNKESRRIQTRRRFELKQVDGSLATIGIDFQILTPIEDPAIEAQLIQRMTSGDATFDIEAGRFRGLEVEVDRRVLGFSGPASSMHYRMRLTERLLAAGELVARQPPRPAGPEPLPLPLPK